MKAPLGSLLRRIAWYHRIFFDQQLTDLDIKGGFLTFLLAINSHQGCSQNELSKLLHMNKTTTTRALRPLMEAKYIVKKPDLQDKRIYRIYLTIKGKKIIPRLKKVVTLWTNALTENFSSEEKALVYDFTQRMMANAKKHITK